MRMQREVWGRRVTLAGLAGVVCGLAGCGSNVEPVRLPNSGAQPPVTAAPATGAGESRTSDIGPTPTTKPAQVPKHLVDADEFVREVGPMGTLYVRGGGKIIWPFIKGGPMCRTDCSGFLNELLTHSMGYGDADLQAWFGVERPLAKHWYGAMAAARGFDTIMRVERLSPGDFLAVAFPPGGEVTGHCMLIAAAPQKWTASAPVVEGLQQWAVEVIDASKTPHGEGDTRYLAMKPQLPAEPNRIEQVDRSIEPVEGVPPGGAPRHSSGLGRGTIRLYSDSNGNIAGYAWSLEGEARFKPGSEYKIVGGRWQVGFDPKTAPVTGEPVATGHVE